MVVATNIPLQKGTTTHKITTQHETKQIPEVVHCVTPNRKDAAEALVEMQSQAQTQPMQKEEEPSLCYCRKCKRYVKADKVYPSSRKARISICKACNDVASKSIAKKRSRNQKIGITVAANMRKVWTGNLKPDWPKKYHPEPVYEVCERFKHKCVLTGESRNLMCIPFFPIDGDKWEPWNSILVTATHAKHLQEQLDSDQTFSIAEFVSQKNPDVTGVVLEAKHAAEKKKEEKDKHEAQVQPQPISQ
jgi:hypothetical protein